MFGVFFLNIFPICPHCFLTRIWSLTFLPEQSKSPSSFTEVNGTCHLTASGVLLIYCEWLRCIPATESQWSQVDLCQLSFPLTEKSYNPNAFQGWRIQGNSPLQLSIAKGSSACSEIDKYMERYFCNNLERDFSFHKGMS